MTKWRAARTLAGWAGNLAITGSIAMPESAQPDLGRISRAGAKWLGSVNWGTARVGPRDLHEGLGEMARTARRRVGLPILAWVLGFSLLSVAWAFANPPGASQDERGQYIKTMGTALGQGNGAPLPAEWRPNSRQGVQLFYWLMRSYRLPTSLIPDARWGCMKYSRDAADCLDRRRPVKPIALHLTQMAKYPPAPYLVLGSVARWMPSARSALYAGRLAGALASVLLLAGAFAVARRGWARVGERRTGEKARCGCLYRQRRN